MMTIMKQEENFYGRNQSWVPCVMKLSVGLRHHRIRIAKHFLWVRRTGVGFGPWLS